LDQQKHAENLMRNAREARPADGLFRVPRSRGKVHCCPSDRLKAELQTVAARDCSTINGEGTFTKREMNNAIVVRSNLSDAHAALSVPRTAAGENVGGISV